FRACKVHGTETEIRNAGFRKDDKPVETKNNPLIGMYASTSRQKVKILGDSGKTKTEGPLVQVSRLANPLVNELIINTSSKDFWNAEEPENEAQFQEFYKNPSVAQALELIFSVPVPPTPRTDLLSLFLKYPGQALDGDNCGKPCAELLRLDLRVAPTPLRSKNS